MNNDFYVTPCKSICEINRSSGLCIGCGRTREEIAKWSTFTHEEMVKDEKEKRISHDHS